MARYGRPSAADVLFTADLHYLVFSVTSESVSKFALHIPSPIVPLMEDPSLAVRSGMCFNEAVQIPLLSHRIFKAISCPVFVDATRLDATGRYPLVVGNHYLFTRSRRERTEGALEAQWNDPSRVGVFSRDFVTVTVYHVCIISSTKTSDVSSRVRGLRFENTCSRPALAPRLALLKGSRREPSCGAATRSPPALRQSGLKSLLWVNCHDTP